VETSAVRDISRGSLFLGLEQATQILFGTLYSMAILRLLGPAFYGILSLGLAVTGLMGIATLNLENYLERFVAEFVGSGRQGLLRPLVRKIYAVKGGLALLAALLLVLLARPVARAYAKEDLGLVLPALAWMIVAEATLLTFRATLFGLQRYRTIWYLALVVNVSKMVMVGIVALTGGGLVALAWGLILVVGATAILAAAVTWRMLPRTDAAAREVPTYRQIWRYLLPLLGARSFYLAGQHLNRVILGALLGARELGLVSFALVTTERFVAMAHAFPLSLLPSMSRLKGQGDRSGIERILGTGFRITAALALVLAVGLFAMAREIIVLVGGFAYLPALGAFQVLSVVYLFRTLNQPLTMTFYTFERTRTVFWLAGWKLLVELGLYPVLIPLWGITGVAVANVASAAAVFLPALFVVRGIFPGTHLQRLGDTSRAWAVAGLLIGLALLTYAKVPLVWPSLLVRIHLVILGLPVGILLARLVRAADFGNLRRAVQAPIPQRILGLMEGVLEKAEGALGG
jgi:O-antigen/teichoic acid export membrane protein